MALVLTVQQDTNLQLSLNNGGALPVDPVDSSTLGPGLPDGTYPNQPLVWDGAAWIPSPGAVAAQNHSGEDNTVAISLPTPVPGFPTQCYWTVETSSILQVTRDSDTGENIFIVVGGPGNPIECRAHDANPPQIGFLGALPVNRQEISGATTQDQVDSLVAALVALGLVNDIRP